MEESAEIDHVEIEKYPGVTVRHVTFKKKKKGVTESTNAGDVNTITNEVTGA